jgi:hypothetical protein
MSEEKQKDEMIVNFLDPSILESGEDDFRRGYVHGYFNAFSDRTKGFTPHQQLAHIDTLMNWRSEEREEFIIPPSINKAQEGEEK